MRWQCQWKTMRGRWQRMNNRKLLACPYLVWSSAFIILPLFMVVYYGCSSENGSFTLDNLLALGDPVHYKAFGMSLLIALASTLICLIIAYPLAYILSKYARQNAGLVVMLFILPMWINFLLRILALQMILSNTGIINALLGFFGISARRMMYTRGAILVGMVYDYIPFMILPIYNAMIKIDQDVIEAAFDLGAGAGLVFRKIIIPLSMPGVISGIIMVFIPSVSEFVVADVLGGSKILLFGNVIEQEFNVANDWHLGSGLSVVLMIFIFASMAVMNRFNTEEGDSVLW